MPAGPVEVIRSFAAENSARWYAVGLARQVRDVGITGLRLPDIPAGPGPVPGLSDIVAEGIFGMGLSAGGGLLEAALARLRATAFGSDAYPDPDAKAAALLHSVARNHALIDGNKRLALAAVIAFYGLNGRRLTLTNDAAYDLVINVAAGQLDAVDDIAVILQPATQSR
jgi:death-on-curing protein